MQRQMMHAKIHRATVTRAELEYVGSVSLCPELLKRSGIQPFEQVHIVDVTNGSRLVTYAMVGEPGEVCINGAAAHLVHPGDLVIIIAYAAVSDEDLATFQPRIVHVDGSNRPLSLAEAQKHASSRRYVTVGAAQEFDDPDC